MEGEYTPFAGRYLKRKEVEGILHAFRDVLEHVGLPLQAEGVRFEVWLSERGHICADVWGYAHDLFGSEVEVRMGYDDYLRALVENPNSLTLDA
jgi:hypothetical protein